MTNAGEGHSGLYLLNSCIRSPFGWLSQPAVVLIHHGSVGDPSFSPRRCEDATDVRKACRMASMLYLGVHESSMRNLPGRICAQASQAPREQRAVMPHFPIRLAHRRKVDAGDELDGGRLVGVIGAAVDLQAVDTVLEDALLSLAGSILRQCAYCRRANDGARPFGEGLHQVSWGLRQMNALTCVFAVFQAVRDAVGIADALLARL
jgi:hypothetical protein